MRSLRTLAFAFACLLFAVVVFVVRVNGQADAMCEAPLVVISSPELAGVNAATWAAVDNYLASVYGTDDRMRVLAFYDDYADMQFVLGDMATEAMAGYSGLALQRIRWNTVLCRADIRSRVRVRVAMVSTRFDGAVLFGLAVHELSHLHGTVDDAGEGDDASWWESIGLNAYQGTCGHLDRDGATHCAALDAVLGMTE